MAPQLLAPFLMPGPVISPVNSTAFMLNSSMHPQNKTIFHHRPPAIVTPTLKPRPEDEDTEIVHESFSAIYRTYRWFLGHRVPPYEDHNTNKKHQTSDKHYLKTEELPGSKQNVSEEDVIVYTAQDGRLHETPVTKFSNSTAQLQISSKENQIKQKNIDNGLSASQITTAAITTREAPVKSSETRFQYALSSKMQKRIDRFLSKSRVSRRQIRKLAQRMLKEASSYTAPSNPDHDAWDVFNEVAKKLEKAYLILQQIHDDFLSYPNYWQCEHLYDSWNDIFLVVDAIRDGVIYLDELKASNMTLHQRLLTHKGLHRQWARSWCKCNKYNPSATAAKMMEGLTCSPLSVFDGVVQVARDVSSAFEDESKQAGQSQNDTTETSVTDNTTDAENYELPFDDIITESDKIRDIVLWWTGIILLVSIVIGIAGGVILHRRSKRYSLQSQQPVLPEMLRSPKQDSLADVC